MKHYKKIFSLWLTVSMIWSVTVNAQADTGTYIESFDTVTASSLNGLTVSNAEALNGRWDLSQSVGKWAVMDGSVVSESSGNGKRLFLNTSGNRFEGASYILDSDIDKDHVFSMSFELACNNTNGIKWIEIANASNMLYAITLLGVNGTDIAESYSPGGNANGVLYTMNMGETYKIEITLNLQTMKQETTVKDMDNNVLANHTVPASTRRDFTWNQSTLKNIDFLGYDNASWYIDNLEMSIEPPPYQDPNIFIENMNFDNCNSINDLRSLGFTINDTENISVGSAFEGDSMSPSMIVNRADMGANLTIIPSAAESGAYKVSYWVYNAPGNLAVDAPMVMNDWTDGSLSLLQVNDNLATVNNLGDGSRGPVIANLKDNTWYRFEHIIDLNKRMVSASAYGTDGSALGQTVHYEFTNMSTDELSDKINHFVGIRFRNWSDVDMCIDNIQASRYFTTPTITDKSVSFTMTNGSVVSEREKIKPNVDSIALNFGSEISMESAEKGIFLTKSDGTQIPFTGVIDKNKYLLKLDRLLEENQKYLLTVTTDVTNGAGIPLERGLEYTFTTGNGEISANLISLTKNGKPLETMTGVPGSKDLCVELAFSNSLPENKNIECLINYYDSKNRIIDKIIYEITANAGQAKQLELKADTVPAECDSIQVLLWNDLESMVAYGDSLSLITK